MTTGVFRVAAARFTPVMLTSSLEKERGRREARSPGTRSPCALVAGTRWLRRDQWLIESWSVRRKFALRSAK